MHLRTGSHGKDMKKCHWNIRLRTLFLINFFRPACSGIQSAAGNAPAAVPSVIFPARSPLAETDIRGSKTGVEKRRFPVRKIENWFSVRKPRVGAKKKYVPCFLKYVPCILKYLRPFFCPLKTRSKTGVKMQTNKAGETCTLLPSLFAAVLSGCGGRRGLEMPESRATSRLNAISALQKTASCAKK